MNNFESDSLENLVRLQGTTRIRLAKPKRRKKFWDQFLQDDGSYLIHSPLWSDFNDDCISWSAAEARDEIRAASGPGYKEPNYWIYLIIIAISVIIGFVIYTLPS